MTNDIHMILTERGDRYGSFAGHADVAQQMKAVIWDALAQRQKVRQPFQMEALEMICHKVARIINGDPNYVENYRDIAGYATLVANRLEKEDNDA